LSPSQPSRTTSRSTRGGRDGRAQTTQPKNGALPHRPEPKELLDAYRQMLLIRRFEEKAGEMYQRAKIGGYCHLNLGEEATCVGLCLGMRPTDYLFTNYREHGYALARGIDPRKVMAELFGREGGVSRGRGGSMHLFDWEKRLLGGYAIVGGQIPVATGAALAIARKGGDDVVVCQMGDATTNIGAFHESLNIAALWKLPIVFAIINNGYGMGTSVEAGSAEPALYKKACAYEMPGFLVDGNDLFVVRAAVHEAVERARKDRVPTLLDIQSYRLKGHSVVDPDRYRSEEYIKEIRAKDPLMRFAERYKEDGVIDDKALEQVEEEVEHMVQAAVDFAEQSPEPDPEKLFEFSYATEVPNQPTALPGKEPWVAA
jgi:pyruvate dehydrogenase E1 component alpha subunit